MESFATFSNYHGYHNPNRSEGVNGWLQTFEGRAASWERLDPSCLQTAKTMKAAGKVIFVLSIILAGLTAVGATVIFSGDLALYAGVAGGGASLALFITSLVLMLKPYWNDPAYRQEKKEGFMEVLFKDGYQAAMDQYGNDVYDKRLLEKDQVGQMLWQEHFAGKTYADMKDVGKTIRDGLYPASMFTHQLLSETQDMTFLEILNKYTYQPILDGVLRPESCLLPSGSYNPTYTPTDQETRTLVERLAEETQEMPWKTFYSEFSAAGSPLPLFWRGFAKITAFQDRALACLKEVGFQQMIETYGGWDLFQHHFLKGDNPEVQAVFAKYLAETEFSEGKVFLKPAGVILHDLIPQAWRQEYSKLSKEFYTAHKTCQTKKTEALAEKEKKEREADKAYEENAPATKDDAFRHALLKETTKDAKKLAKETYTLACLQADQKRDKKIPKINTAWASYVKANPITDAK